jgi:hypothetical protein
MALLGVIVGAVIAFTGHVRHRITYRQFRNDACTGRLSGGRSRACLARCRTRIQATRQQPSTGLWP